MKVHSHSEKEKQALEYLRLVPFCIFMHSILESARCTTIPKGSDLIFGKSRDRSLSGKLTREWYVWMVGDRGQWTSGQVGSSHLMKSWDTITTGRDYCLVPSALFRQWDFGRKFLDITQTPLLQNPWSHILYSLYTTTYTRAHLSLLKLDLNELAGGDRGRRRQSRNC